MPDVAEPEQLTIDGELVPHRDVIRRPRPLSAAQRAILRHLRARGRIRSGKAGEIVHAHRERPCAGRPGVLCCPWAASDGYDALMRLYRRGLVRHVARGEWVVR